MKRRGAEQNTQASRMRTRDFLSEVVEFARVQLRGELSKACIVGPMASLIKMHYGDAAVHYEVWAQRRHGIIEVGLHFEGTQERNAAYLQALQARSKEIRAALGRSIEFEHWTRSWTRIHEHIPLEALDSDMLVLVGHRLARMISVLQPMVREFEA